MNMKIEKMWMKQCNNYYKEMKNQSRCESYEGKLYKTNNYVILMVRSTDKESVLLSRLSLDKRKSRTKCWINGKKSPDIEDLYNEKKSFLQKKPTDKNDSSR